MKFKPPHIPEWIGLAIRSLIVVLTILTRL